MNKAVKGNKGPETASGRNRAFFSDYLLSVSRSFWQESPVFAVIMDPKYGNTG